MRRTSSPVAPTRIEALRDAVREQPIELGQQVRYLDLSGDGVPDTVLTLDRHFVDERAGCGMIEEVISIAVGIDVDGRPADKRCYGRLIDASGRPSPSSGEIVNQAQRSAS
jgi:hypothetical protein